jgi:hypothetical protein
MPWTTKDVDKFKRGLSDDQKRRWVAIANGSLAECMEQNDAEEIDCEVRAIRIANATVEGQEKQAAIALADKPNPLHIDDVDSTIHVALAEATEDGEYQLAFPIGLFKTGKYGEMIITRTFAERLQEHWQAKVLGERNVFMDVNHDFNEAAAWARNMRVSDDGLEVAWEFNSRGRELISDRRYRYYSAAIGGAIDMQTGDLVFPVLHAVSLTNMPVMNNMPAAHLSDDIGKNPAHGDGENNHKEESMKTLAEIIGVLLALSTDELGKATDDQKDEIAKALGLELADDKELSVLRDKVSVSEDKIKVLASENRDLSEQVKAYKDAEAKADRDTVIEKALSDGKILPKNRETWERLFEADPEGTKQILDAKGKEIDYDKAGSSRAADTTFSDADNEAFRMFRDANPDLTEEQARKTFLDANGGE